MKRWQLTFDRLDALSRTRALTDQESELLEVAIFELDRPERNAPPTRNFAWSRDQEIRFEDHIRGGMSIGQAAVCVGKSRGAGAGKWNRMKAAAV